MISTTDSTLNSLSNSRRIENGTPGDFLLAEIKCSLCLLAPYPYLQFCKAGHVMCQRCSVLCHKCPRKSEHLDVCDQPIIPISLQSSLHHKILGQWTTPSPEDVINAAEVGSSKSEVTRVAEQSQSQVVMVGKCPFDGCDYVSLMEDNLLSHVTTAHDVPIVTEADAEIETRWNTIGRRIAVILNCYEQHFMLLIFEHENGMVYLWMSRINLVGSKNDDLRVQLRLQKPISVEHSSEERLYSIQTVMDPNTGLYEPDENCLILRKEYILKNLSSVSKCTDEDPQNSKPASSIFISIVSGKTNHVPYSPSSCNAEKAFVTNDDYPPVERSQLSSPSWELFMDSSSTEFRRDVQLHGFVNKHYPQFVLKPPDTLPIQADCETEKPGPSKTCVSNVMEEPWPIPIRNPIFEQSDPPSGTVVVIDGFKDDPNLYCPFSSETYRTDDPISDDTGSTTPVSFVIDQKAKTLDEERKNQDMPDRKVSIKSLNYFLRKPMPKPSETLQSPQCGKSNLLKELESIRIPTISDEKSYTHHLPTISDAKSYTPHLPTISAEKSFTQYIPTISNEKSSTQYAPTISDEKSSTHDLSKVSDSNDANDGNPEFSKISQSLDQTPAEKTPEVQPQKSAKIPKVALAGKLDSLEDIDSVILKDLELDGFENFLYLGAFTDANLGKNGNSASNCLFGDQKKQKKNKSYVRYKSGLIQSK